MTCSTASGIEPSTPTRRGRSEFKHTSLIYFFVVSICKEHLYSVSLGLDLRGGSRTPQKVRLEGISLSLV